MTVSPTITSRAPSRSLRSALGGLMLLVLTACASSEASKEFNDPLEGWNRGVFAFNRVVDRAVLDPIVSGYQAVVPKTARKGISNVVDNLFEPLNAVNLALQGEFGDSGKSLVRFITNSTIGLAGLFDVASDAGLPEYNEDFGQTLAVWGVPDGPYLVLPFFGPSNVRDGVGQIANNTINPTAIGVDKLDVRGLQIIVASGQTIDFRSRLDATIDQLYKEKDPYAFARAAFRQQRRFAICNGRCPEDKAEEEDLFDDLDEDYEDEDDGGK